MREREKERGRLGSREREKQQCEENNWGSNPQPRPQSLGLQVGAPTKQTT